MASFLTPSRYGIRLLQLPPSLRVSVYQHATSNRAFSSTARRPFNAVEALTTPAITLLDAVHNVGIPWFAAIPLTAVIVRSTVIYYLSALPARKTSITRASLSPLLAAAQAQEYKRWSLVWKEQTVKKNKTTVIKLRGEQRLRHQVQKIWISLKVAHQVGKKFGAPLFTWRSWTSFAVLITFLEALRIKAGKTEGLLTLLTGSIKPGADPGRATMSPEELLAERLAAARESQSATRQASHQTQDLQTEHMLSPSTQELSPQIQDVALSSLSSNDYADTLDPSLKMEGLAWCQDLTMPDSTFVLPVALMLTLVMNTMLRPVSAYERERSARQRIRETPPVTTPGLGSRDLEKLDAAVDEYMAGALPNRAPEKKKRQQSNNLTTQQRAGLTAALIFGIISTNLPAALLLYLIPNMFLVWVQARYLDMKHPIPQRIPACRLPMRTKVRRDLRDT